MCLETISIAVCAPTKIPTLSFTCGKLHLIASQRYVCEDAFDQCVCYFGTCGNIKQSLGNKAIDLAELNKVRCVQCTEKQDDVGDGRKGQEILESPLLDRDPISISDENARDKYFAKLKSLWGDQPACPYHAIANPVALGPTADKASTSNDPWNDSIHHVDHEVVSIKTIQETIEETVVTTAASTEPEFSQPAAPEPEVETTVHFESPSFTNEQCDDLQNDDIDDQNAETGLESSCWAPENSPEKKTEAFTRPPRRDIPVATPKITPKVREATRQLSSVRAFLTSRA